MRYEEFAPASPLRDTVAAFWRFTVLDPATREHTVVPDGAVNIVWARGAAILVGPRITALRVPVTPHWDYWGIRLMPGVARTLIPIDVPDTRERAAPLYPIAPRAAAEFTAAMTRTPGIPALESVAQSWLERAQPPDPLVQELTRAIIAANGIAPIHWLCQNIGIGYRQLLRRFHRDVGMTPKEFARLRRIRWACIQALESGESWARISAGTGFSDQSHLSREFAGVFGWPPELVKEYLGRIHHHLV